jgi:nitroimidazol reductase NimA-like FMN-containing flavoprotein (pyridoxamine 5'-phosphate oxidase superfamily)
MKGSSKLRETLRELFASQKFAALATEDSGQPHNCLVAFAATDDLKHLLFATSRDTSKYRNLMTESRVAILVDSRSNQDSDFRNAIAVTARGIAKEAKGNQKARLVEIYLAKHPQLADFVNSAENALIKATINDYVISTFSNVTTLRPP